MKVERAPRDAEFDRRFEANSVMRKFSIFGLCHSIAFGGQCPS